MLNLLTSICADVFLQFSFDPCFGEWCLHCVTAGRNACPNLEWWDSDLWSLMVHLNDCLFIDALLSLQPVVPLTTSIIHLAGTAAGRMSILWCISVLFVCVNCMLVFNPVCSIICLELSLWRLMYLPPVYVTDDEVCLGQLQALRLGPEWAEAFDTKWAYWQHVWWVWTFLIMFTRPGKSSGVFL